MPAEHIAGRTFHGRRGPVRNAFRYSVDYVLLDAETSGPLPRLFARNGRNLAALNDADHGGAPGRGTGAAWVRRVLAARGLDLPGPVLLLAQPRLLGHVFNPVAFWLCHDRRGALCAVIAEVSNTYRDRHSYLVAHDDLRPIAARDRLAARKIFHVSPFQPAEGRYSFGFDISPGRIAIRIDYAREGGGLVATLEGARRPLTDARILGALLRRPGGSRRVLGLIHWQALRLWWKGARFRPRPDPPESDVSR